MLDVNEIFRGRKANKEALKAYGFKQCGGAYEYEEEILGGQFKMRVRAEDGKVNATVYDTEADCPYYLFTVESAEGAFVGAVRAEYERILLDISDKCYARAEVYREDTAKAVIRYAKGKYGTPLEFLWHDENSIMRRKDNRKWYALFMLVKREKLGLEGEGLIEIIDLRAPAAELTKLVDGVNYLPAYHMNKKSWLTVPLDGRVHAEVINALVDMSYELAKGKK